MEDAEKVDDSLIQESNRLANELQSADLITRVTCFAAHILAHEEGAQHPP